MSVFYSSLGFNYYVHCTENEVFYQGFLQYMWPYPQENMDSLDSIQNLSYHQKIPKSLDKTTWFTARRHMAQQHEGTSKKDINKDISITHKAGWQLH